MGTALTPFVRGDSISVLDSGSSRPSMAYSQQPTLSHEEASEANNPDFVITLSFDKGSEGRVTLAFTLGVAAVDKGLKTTIVLLIHGVHIARKDYADDIDIGEPFLPVKDLMEVYLEHGGEISVCGSCWRFNHIPDDERMQQVKMITAADVVDLLMNAKSSIQLN